MDQTTELLMLTVDEHKVLMEDKSRIETLHGVSITLPDIVLNNPSCENDVIFASISGEKQKIRLSKFLMEKKVKKIRAKRKKAMFDGIPLITLSDSDSVSPSTTIIEGLQKAMKKRKLSDKKKKKRSQYRKRVLVGLTPDNKTCEVTSTTEPEQQKIQNEKLLPVGDIIPLCSKSPKENDNCDNADESIIILEEIPGPGQRVNSAVSQGIIILEEVPGPVQRVNLAVTQPVQIMNELVPKPVQIINGLVPKPVQVINGVPRPIVEYSRLLRPVVIDGSNVAREHGKITNTYSCKGIQIAVDHFLRRGHPQVTAFVPNFRRHIRTYGPILSTDVHLLEILALSQHVVFTPSRKVNGKTFTCYDDRFIVQLASQNGGVILSNDNYKDLMGESAEFKKTIEERLLMFCFVGDLLMIPNDPLGRHGPCLNEYLSYPVTVAHSATA